MHDAALVAAGIIFLVIFVLHLLRLIFKVEVKVGSSIIPLWLSIPGLIVSLLLSLWMFCSVD